MNQNEVELVLLELQTNCLRRIGREFNLKINQTNWYDGFYSGYSQALLDTAKKLRISLSQTASNQNVKISEYYVAIAKERVGFDISDEMIRCIIRFLVCFDGLEYSITMTNVCNVLIAILETLTNKIDIVKKYPRGDTLKIDVDNCLITEYFPFTSPIEYSDDYLTDIYKNHRAFKKRKDKPSISIRKNIKGTIRQNVLMRDNYTCQICGATVKDGAKLEIDHIKPVSKGGTDNENNLQVLCQQCNREKHNRDDLLHDKMKLAELEGK